MIEGEKGMSGENRAAAESFLNIFMGFRRRLARTIARIVRPDDIEDIVQETFIRCYQASGRTSVRHPRAFMLATARNLALNHIELADNRLVAGVDDFDDEAVPLFRDGAESSPEVQERFFHLCRAVRTLPVQCRRAFVLKKVYGLSRKEIADYMSLSESTVQKHIAKGMAMCAEYMEELERAPQARAGAPTRALQKRSSR